MTDKIDQRWFSRVSLARFVSIGTLLLTAPSAGLATAADVPAITNLSATGSTRDDGLLKWRVKGPGGEDSGREVVIRGYRHSTPERDSFLFNLIVTTESEELGATLSRTLDAGKFRTTRNNYETIINDFNELSRSGRLRALVVEGFIVTETRAEMEKHAEMYDNFRRQHLLPILQNEQLLKKVRLQLWGPENDLFMAGKLSEDLKLVQLDNLYYADKWEQTIRIIDKMMKDLDFMILGNKADFQNYKKFAAMMYVQQASKFLDVDDKEMNPVIDQFSGTKAQELARTIFFLHKNARNLYQARECAMANRIKEVGAQLKPGEVAYVTTGRRHLEGLSVTLDADIKPPEVRNSGAMERVQQAAVRAFVRDLEAARSAAFKGWETQPTKNGMLFSGKDEALAFSYVPSGVNFAIRITGERVFDQVKTEAEKIEGAEVLDVTQNGVRELVVIVSRPLFHAELRKEILGEVKAAGLSLDGASSVTAEAQ